VVHSRQLRIPQRALGVLLALAACGPSGEARGQVHVLRIADNVDPSSLNPLLAHDQDTIGYDLLVTETLVGLSARNHLVPVLITRVPSRVNGDISPDGKTIVYHLKPGVRFADGKPLTSADVAFTYRAILDPRNPVESVDAYRRITALLTPDKTTVVVRLKERWNAAVAEIFAQSDFAFGILPAHAFGSTDVTRAAWNQLPFGTGPFRVTRWRRGSEIVLDPNPYYRPRPKLQRIVFPIIPTTQASLVALRAGDLDLTELGPLQFAEARGLAGIRIAITPLNGEYMLIVRVTAAPTDDVRVRRALDAAIDRSEIVRGRFGTLAPADSYLPPVFVWHDSAPQAAKANWVEATRELEAAGWRRVNGWWSKQGRRLSLAIDLDPERGTWMQLVEQEQLRRFGIDVELKPFPTSQFNAADGPMRSGRFTIAAAQWIGGADPEQSVIFGCGQRGNGGNNASNYCSRRFDMLFKNQAVAADPRKRRSDTVEMQRLVRQDVPIVPIAFESNVDAVSDRVVNFRRNMLAYPVDAAYWDVR
jgi:peptide/nickel transport system substrate-binding protein